MGVTAGIVGSRSFDNYDYFDCILNTPWCPVRCISKIITGGAEGTDTLAMRYAKDDGIKCEVYKPDYEQHGNRAPHIRNRAIVEDSDVILAFWDGKSKGTLSTIKQATAMGVAVHIIPVNGVL